MKFKKTLAAIVVGVLAAGIAATPAEASVSQCYVSSICFYNNTPTWQAGSPYVPNRDVADAPRNTCFADLGTYQSVSIINNSQYRWYLFRTTTCGGSHIEVAPYSQIYPDITWWSIHGYYRTSSTS